MTEYIDREKLIEHLKKDPLFDFVERYGITCVIESIPAADVRPVVRAEWLEEPGHIPHCSKCGRYSNDADEGAIFCPFCGAMMEES